MRHRRGRSGKALSIASSAPQVAQTRTFPAQVREGEDESDEDEEDEESEEEDDDADPVLKKPSATVIKYLPHEINLMILMLCLS